jgi:hypothetical protein
MRSLRRREHEWEDNINIDFKETRFGCEHEPKDSIKAGNFIMVFYS